ncbi:MAG: hypothetical protein P4M11_13785 [Candidatus Pacebacteria bacterium]|nr:hypothetical protein [Candidatus Paceibacterota bacterium]
MSDNAILHKVFYSDITHTREKVLRVPKKDTERAEIFIRVEMELKKMFEQRAALALDSVAANNFGFEKAKMKELHLEPQTPSFDADDTSVRNILLQIQANSEEHKLISDRVMVVAVLYLLLILCEMMVEASLLVGLLCKGVPWQHLSLWLGAGIVMCGLEAGLLAHTLAVRKCMTTVQAARVIYLSVLLVTLYLLLVTFASIEIVRPTIVFPLEDLDKDNDTIMDVRGIIMFVSLVNVIFQSTLAYLLFRLKQVLGRLHMASSLPRAASSAGPDPPSEENRIGNGAASLAAGV